MLSESIRTCLAYLPQKTYINISLALDSFSFRLPILALIFNPYWLLNAHLFTILPCCQTPIVRYPIRLRDVFDQRAIVGADQFFAGDQSRRQIRVGIAGRKKLLRFVDHHRRDHHGHGRNRGSDGASFLSTHEHHHHRYIS